MKEQGNNLYLLLSWFGLVLFGSVRIPKLLYSVFQYFTCFGLTLSAAITILLYNFILQKLIAENDYFNSADF